ncbi:MAG: hypothetical protein QOJ65_1459 [Fimbriimonadaceae bacterium]|nr:hypothetical protein [Fimbriimonadaceae bacterium]
MTNSNELLQRIERSYVTATAPLRDVVECGPFWLFINPGTRLVWLNGAVVANDQPITREWIREMVGGLKERDRQPRMELFAELRPELIRDLQAEGFVIESEMPMMVATIDTFIPQSSGGVRVEIMNPESDLVPFLRVADISFEHDEPITPERLERTRQGFKRGTHLGALAYIDGQPAAVASLVASDGVAELAGVGTHPDFRRRGAASTVSTVLLQEFFKTADLAWLSAGDDTSRAVYERLGFKLAGTQVNIALPEGQ